MASASGPATELACSAFAEAALEESSRMEHVRNEAAQIAQVDARSKKLKASVVSCKQVAAVKQNVTSAKKRKLQGVPTPAKAPGATGTVQQACTTAEDKIWTHSELIELRWEDRKQGKHNGADGQWWRGGMDKDGSQHGLVRIDRLPSGVYGITQADHGSYYGHWCWYGKTGKIISEGEW